MNWLVSWIGNDDLLEARGAREGPVASFLRAQPFDRVLLLHDGRAEAAGYQVWLSMTLRVRAELLGVQLDRPQDLDGVHEKTLEVLDRLAQRDDTFRTGSRTYLLGSGTLPMAAALILVGCGGYRGSLYTNWIDPADPTSARRPIRVRAFDRFALSHWPLEEAPRASEEIFRDAEGREITRVASVREVYERARQAAESDAPVLILGETGTGKELLARYLHASSPRARGALVPVNCGAIPAGSIDAHLFGHARGAFPGAVADSQGMVGAASGGTLFLDEIAELPLETQGRLLRLLQDGEALPVGATAARRADVRIVAATHRNLRKLIREERFREDLYFRLAQYVFLLPPLRERRDDLELLCDALVKRWRDERGVTARIDRGAWQALRAYDWPGNVRELQAILTRALIDARRGGGGELIIDRAIVERALREQGLGPGILPEEPAADWIDPVLAQVTASGRTYGEALHRIEAALIGRAMRQCRSRAEAARRLGMTPQALHAKLKTLQRHGLTV